jgi:hypothetical protein
MVLRRLTIGRGDHDDLRSGCDVTAKWVEPRGSLAPETSVVLGENFVNITAVFP